MGGNRRLAPEYEELLMEHKRDLKRRKAEVLQPEPDHAIKEAPSPHTYSSESEWDEVDLDQPDDEDQSDGEPENIPSEVVSVSFEPSELSAPKRLRLFSRQQRVDIHTLCLTALILHTRIRNFWISAPQINQKLRNFLPTIIQQELHPPSHLSYNLKTKKLMDGIRASMRLWSQKFTITSLGLYCVDWEEIKDTDRVISPSLTEAEFLDLLQKLRGPIDIMTQGFCALLRANGLECRLVCSLQPPDFASPGKVDKNRKPPPILERPPIYWTEVWDPYSNQWLSADPCQQLVQIVRGKSSFEPRITDSRNILRYCVAWNRGGRLRDVTRRYASQYNARTRKKRLAHLGKAYASVYERILAKFSGSPLQQRDLEELKQLNRREQTEGIPARVQDFVGHPIYVLEHQLKKTEYLDPKAPCGRIALKDGVSCPIYLRRDVKQCFSARSWYRKGRVLVAGEQPKLKRKSKNLAGEEEEVGLYSKHQTQLYIPDPVVNGQVPKSEYGTIDLFAPSMLPRDAAYIVDPLGEKAAKALGVDYARAVVGAEFERRSVKTVYRGVVVPANNAEAVQAVCEGLRELELEEKERQETARVMAIWRRMIIGVRIWNRIEQMNPESGQVKLEVAETSHPECGRGDSPTDPEPGPIQASTWDPGLDSDSDVDAVKPSAWDPGSSSDSEEEADMLARTDGETVYALNSPDTDGSICKLEDQLALDADFSPAKVESSEAANVNGNSGGPAPASSIQAKATNKMILDVKDIFEAPQSRPLPVFEEPPPMAPQNDPESDLSDFPDIFLDEDECYP